MSAGSLVPDELVNELVEERLSERTPRMVYSGRLPADDLLRESVLLDLSRPQSGRGSGNSLDCGLQCDYCANCGTPAVSEVWDAVQSALAAAA